MKENGEARSENTGSVSQKRPRSLSSTVECPSRNSVRSGAARSCAFVSACTWMGWSGAVPEGLLTMKSQKMPTVFQKPCSGSTAGLWKRPFAHCGEDSSGGWVPSGAGADTPGSGVSGVKGDAVAGEDITREAVMARAPAISTAATPPRAVIDSGSNERGKDRRI